MKTNTVICNRQCCCLYMPMHYQNNKTDNLMRSYCWDVIEECYTVNHVLLFSNFVYCYYWLIIINIFDYALIDNDDTSHITIIIVRLFTSQFIWGLLPFFSISFLFSQLVSTFILLKWIIERIWRVYRWHNYVPVFFFIVTYAPLLGKGLISCATLNQPSTNLWILCKSMAKHTRYSDYLVIHYQFFRYCCPIYRFTQFAMMTAWSCITSHIITAKWMYYLCFNE